MNEIQFKVDGDLVIKYTPMPELGEKCCKTEIVMTKEIFQECYKKWIEPQESEPDNKGKWEKIWRTDCECSEYVCSKCGCGEDYWTNFCPNCGADMRGDKAE